MQHCGHGRRRWQCQSKPDGRGQVKKVKIDPSLVGQSDAEMLEDLIVVAVNDAQKKATELAQVEMGKLTGGMDLPFKLPI